MEPDPDTISMEEIPQDFDPTPEPAQEPTSEDTPNNRKVSDEDRQERIDFARQLLRKSRFQSKIRKQFQERYPGTHWRTVDDYCSRAREQAKLDHERTRAELRADLGEVLHGVMEDGRQGDIVSAAREYARLYGLNLETPPVEVIADQLGITVEQFYGIVAQHTGRTVPDTPKTGGGGTES